MSSVETIVKHADVSRAMDGNGRAILTRRGVNLAAIDRLVALRKSRRNVKRAAANRREEAEFAERCEARGGPGAAYDAGYAVETPKMPTAADFITQALEAGGLPADLEALCREFVAKGA